MESTESTALDVGSTAIYGGHLTPWDDLGQATNSTWKGAERAKFGKFGEDSLAITS